MSDRSDLVRDIIAAAGGEVVGRIRMQKIAYLLDRLGMKVGLDFAYHHYGPYSEEITIALERARWLDKSIDEEERPSQSGYYSIFRSKNGAAGRPEQLGRLGGDRAAEMIELINGETSVVAELAATIYWLQEEEQVEDWRTELRRRKPVKATVDNVAKAEALLEGLGAKI